MFTCKYNTGEYCHNTCKFEAILKRFSVRINFKSQFQSNNLPQALKYIKIASKLTSIVTILASIAFTGEHIFQVLAEYL